jgi:hypothetical protein
MVFLEVNFHHLAKKKKERKLSVTHVKDFIKKGAPKSLDFKEVISEINIFRHWAPAGCQDIAGFFSNFLSEVAKFG